MRWKKRVTRKRHDPRVSPAPGARPRTLPGYQRETAALLIVGHRFHHAQAVRALARWRGFIRSSWESGKPPCWTSDHVAKYERRGDAPRSGGYRRDLPESIGHHGYEPTRQKTEAEKARERERRHRAYMQSTQYQGHQGSAYDPPTMKSIRRWAKAAVVSDKGKFTYFPSRKAALRAASRLARHTRRKIKVVTFFKRKGSGSVRWVRRDAPGDIYESRAGVRWEVLSVENGKVKVKRLGMKDVGPLIWKKSVLDAMKKTGHERPSAVGSGPKPVQQSLFGGLFAPDPRRRRYRRKS